MELTAADEQVLRELTERARTGGLKLTGEGGLLGKLANMVIEGPLEGELEVTSAMRRMTQPGVMAVIPGTATGPRRCSPIPAGGNQRAAGPGRQFGPKIVAKRQRRLTGVDEIVISLSAKGADRRGDRRAPGRSLWRGGVQADDHRDHRAVMEVGPFVVACSGKDLDRCPWRSA